MRTKKYRIANREIALLAVFLGLMVLFTFVTPVVSLFGVIGTAFIILIIVASAAISEGLAVGMAAGGIFGLFSFAVSFFIPQPLAPAFQNPIISVLPRIFIGAAVFFTYKFMKKAVKNPGKKRFLSFVQIGAPAAVGALFNTAAVLGLMAAFYYGREVGSGYIINPELLMTIAGTNGAVEFLLTFLLTPPIVTAAVKFRKANSIVPVKKDARAEGRGKKTTAEGRAASVVGSTNTGDIIPSNTAAAPSQKNGQAIRGEARKRVYAMSADRRADADRRIFERLTGLGEVKEAKNIMIYNSAGHEPETEKLRGYLLKEGKNVYLPVLDSDGGMTAVKISANTEYAKNVYGIDEPRKGDGSADGVPAGELDAVIVPLVAFDKNKNRLGRGKGYYDKFLSGISAVKIGAAYGASETECIEAEKHDVRLDIIVTENGQI
ncbi:MAG: 5-formyltetrahydrofolate cyclo-ligase [Clostridiales bacterium]|jgi:5-formyltetrahydrofolate cyclo-ligase|nr:5-formyltetrahydrofolate cyclo-ligase [Clostridiales bacterium]